jgi:hypothetical protein
MTSGFILVSCDFFLLLVWSVLRDLPASTHQISLIDISAVNEDDGVSPPWLLRLVTFPALPLNEKRAQCPIEKKEDEKKVY